MTLHTRLAWLRATVHHAIASILSLLWIPTDIDGCLLWLRASRGVLKSGSLVTTWIDQVGDHTVRASTIVERPAFLTNAEAFYERAAIRFAGVGEVLKMSGGVRLPFGGDAFTAFVVFSPAAVGIADGTLLSWGDSLPHVGIRIRSDSVFEAYLEGSYSSDIGLMAGKPYLLGIVYGEEKLTLYANGLALKTFTGVEMSPAEDDAIGQLSVGGDAVTSGSFHGDLGDVVVYGRALSGDELEKVCSELIDHYAIRSSYGFGWFQKLKDYLEGLLLRVRASCALG